MKKFDNVMIDLETLGTKPGCVVMSIGAVYFDPITGELGPEFYVVINSEDSLDRGLKAETQTMAWWSRQNEESANIIDESYFSKITLPEALNQFSRFLREYDWQKTKVWGNGSDFDNAILSACYSVVGQIPPWEFWNNRCYRTMKNLVPYIKIQQRSGIYHNALDDARTQAIHLAEINQHIRLV